MTHIEDRWDRADRYGKGLRYRVRYVDPDGHERSRSFAKKGDADKFSTATAADLLRGVYSDPKAGQVTLGSYAEEWLASRVDLRPNTLALYRSVLDTHVLPQLGAKRLANVKPSDVRYAVAAWSQTISASSVRTVFLVLSGIMSAAERDGLIVKSPARGTPLPQPVHRAIEPLAPASVLALMDAITPRYRVAVVLGAAAGLRSGEVRGLTLPRVDFTRRRISVQEQLQPLTPGGVGVLSPLKTAASRRVVPVDDLVLETLARHVEVYGVHESDEIVLTNSQGGTVRRGSFTNRWTAAVEAAGLPVGTRFHDLRHFYASTLIAAGLHPKAIQTRLGHASITETMDVYGHLFPEHEEAGRGFLDAALRSSADGPATAQGGGLLA